MLSKSKGQILRVSAALHILFQLHVPSTNHNDEEKDDEIVEVPSVNNELSNVAESSNTITDKALCAAIDFVETSTQHAAYIAGKDTIGKELAKTGIIHNI